MKYEIKLNIKGLLLKYPERALMILEDEFSKGLDESLGFIMREVVRGTPIFHGQAAESVFKEIRGSGMYLHGVVASNLNRIGFLEEGIPAHTPNYANLSEWIRLKLGLTGPHLYAVLQVISKQIVKRGIKPAFMFKKAWAAGQIEVEKIMKKVEERVAKHLNE